MSDPEKIKQCGVVCPWFNTRAGCRNGVQCKNYIAKVQEITLARSKDKAVPRKEEVPLSQSITSNLLGSKLKGLLGVAPKAAPGAFSSPDSSAAVGQGKHDKADHNQLKPADEPPKLLVKRIEIAKKLEAAKLALVKNADAAVGKAVQEARDRAPAADTPAPAAPEALTAAAESLVVVVANLDSRITARDLAEFLDERGCILNKIELQHEHNWQSQNRTKVGILECDDAASVRSVYEANGVELLGKLIEASLERTAKFLTGHSGDEPTADVQDLPAAAEGEKIVLPANWLRAFGISYLEKEKQRVGAANAAKLLCPADISHFVEFFDTTKRPIIPDLSGGKKAARPEGAKAPKSNPNQPKPAQSSTAAAARPQTGPNDQPLPPPSTRKVDGGWDTAAANSQSKREVNLAEQQRLHFEMEREAILAERQAAVAAANDEKAAKATSAPPRRYHDEGDDVMASLMDSAASASVLDNNVGKVGGFAARQKQQQPAQVPPAASNPFAALDDDEGVVDSFLRERATMGGSSLLAGSGGILGLGNPLGNPPDDVFGGALGSLDLDFSDSLMAVGDDGGALGASSMFDFDSLLSETEVVGGAGLDLDDAMASQLLGSGFADLDAPEERVLAQVAPEPQQDQQELPVPVSPVRTSSGTRVSMSALFSSKAGAASSSSSSSALAPKAVDVLSLYEVEAGETIPASEKERIATTPPSDTKTGAGGADASPFAFHGSSVGPKSSSAKKKPAMSAVSRMQLLKMQSTKKTPVKAAGEGEGASPAGMVRVRVDGLFGK